MLEPTKATANKALHHGEKRRAPALRALEFAESSAKDSTGKWHGALVRVRDTHGDLGTNYGVVLRPRKSYGDCKWLIVDGAQ